MMRIQNEVYTNNGKIPPNDDINSIIKFDKSFN